jgi:hypothetical protein
VKPIVIFFGPHHEGTPAALLEEEATTLVAIVKAATLMTLATTAARDLKRIKLFPFLVVRQTLTHYSTILRSRNLFYAG